MKLVDVSQIEWEDLHCWDGVFSFKTKGQQYLLPKLLLLDTNISKTFNLQYDADKVMPPIFYLEQHNDSINDRRISIYQVKENGDPMLYAVVTEHLHIYDIKLSDWPDYCIFEDPNSSHWPMHFIRKDICNKIKVCKSDKQHKRRGQLQTFWIILYKDKPILEIEQSALLATAYKYDLRSILLQIAM